MINLLPYDEKEAVLQERLRRFIVVAGLYVSCVLAIGIVLMASSYVSLIFEKRDVARELELTEQAPALFEADEFEKGISGLKRKLAILDSAAKEKKPVASLFLSVIRLLPDGIALNLLSYSRGTKNVSEQIILNGRANTRGNFLLFIKKLEGSGNFKKIDSPVSNILRETNLDFTLTLHLN